MAEYITLLGAEEVSSAARTINDAASSMNNVAGNLDSVLERHHRFMEDWLQQLQTILEEHRNGLAL